jgi:aspartate racemase
MGPAATVDFYDKLVRATPATCDQDHLRIVIWSDSSTPDRTRALLGNGPDPTPWLINGVRALTAAGAELIAIPCNTAHAFLGPLRCAAGEVPILDMIQRTTRRVRALDPPAHPLGLLATTGTIVARLYHAPLEQAGIRVIVPDEPGGATMVMRAIKQIKAGQDGAELLYEAGRKLVARGANAILAGCTEVTLALGESRLPVPLIDPAQILAEDAVAWALSRYPSRFRDWEEVDVLSTRSSAG